jgi:hypothetical protein
MEKIKNINNIELHNGNCLIKISGDYNTETKSGIFIGDEAVKYNKNVHATRTGILTKLPTYICWGDMRWETDSFPERGDEVWADFVDMSEENAMRITDGSNIYVILPFTSLLMARNKSGDIKLLNGYLLAQKVPIPMTELDIKQRYYDDIYYIKYDGKPNLRYKEQGALDGSKKAYVDDTSITAGDEMYMTRTSAYPILEESLHWRFSKETYYCMQRKDIICEVEEL